MKSRSIILIFIILFILFYSLLKGKNAKYTKDQEFVRDMMDHAFRNYIKYAFSHDYLDPIDAKGVDMHVERSGFGLIDAISTLHLM